ncbi:hypothetical protein EZV62_006243 [Acer yangbiense]|uniref:Uncharacterized protein n=1 Tax=Acer yangbiense TaxID=1000413 RepID=A0A5C7IQD6_9ROSI|nr:hypothetical protein EZV62_006243 [Acer yangbiense]
MMEKLKYVFVDEVGVGIFGTIWKAVEYFGESFRQPNYGVLARGTCPGEGLELSIPTVFGRFIFSLNFNSMDLEGKERAAKIIFSIIIICSNTPPTPYDDRQEINQTISESSSSATRFHPASKDAIQRLEKVRFDTLILMFSACMFLEEFSICVDYAVVMWAFVSWRVYCLCQYEIPCDCVDTR